MTLPLTPGTVVAGKFRVERILAEGGMGIVVRARHVQLDQRVAIKFLLPEAVTSAEAVHRFLREAQVAARIQSEYVVRTYDMGTLETGEPYIVMEYLEGQDLAHVLSAQKRLPVSEAVEYVLQACEALAEAHALGIVHRDLKPANLFLARRADGSPLVKVLDFGISKMRPKEGSAAITSTNSLFGSPLYMAPEQMRMTRSATARSDIWSLGMVLYELLAGFCPFEADTLPEVVARVIADAIPSLRAARPEVPAALEAVIERCAQKDPEKRFASVAELAQALAPFAPVHQLVSVERAVRISQRGLPDTVPPSASGERPPVSHEDKTVVDPTVDAGETAALDPSGGRPRLVLAGTFSPYETHGGSPRKRRVATAAVAGALLSLGIVALAILRQAPSATPTAAATSRPSATAVAPLRASAVASATASAGTTGSDSGVDKPVAVESLPSAPPVAAPPTSPRGRPRAPAGPVQRATAPSSPAAAQPSAPPPPSGTAAFGHGLE